MTFQARREARWEYVDNCVQHIEEHNCVRGCQYAVPVVGVGPGGACEILLQVILEEPVPQIKDDGTTLKCLMYKAIEQP